MFTANDVKTLRERTGAGMLDCKKALQETEGNIENAIDWLREKGISKAAKKEGRVAAEGLCQIKTNGNKAVILEVNSETDFVAKNEEFKSFVDEIATIILDKEIATVEELLALEVNGQTVADMQVAITAKIGEKISIRRFEVITKEDSASFGGYLHMGGKIAALMLINNVSEEIAKDVAMHVAAMNPTSVTIEEVPAEVSEREAHVIKEQVMAEGKPAEIAEKMVTGRLNKFYKEICLVEQPFVKDDSVTVGKFVANNNGEIVKMIRFAVGEGIEKQESDFASEVMAQINN